MIFSFERPFAVLRDKFCSEDKLKKLLERALPIVQREALGTRPTRDTWELLESIRKEVE